MASTGDVYGMMLGVDPMQAQQQQLGYTHPTNVQQRVGQNNGLYDAMMSVGQMRDLKRQRAQADVDKVHAMEQDGGGLL